MADQLNPIVQKMIDAGESEENIASVIQHFKQSAPSQTLQPVSPSEPDTYWGGVAKSLKEQFGAAAGPMPTGDEMPFTHATSPAVQHLMTTPLMHPTGVNAIDSLSSPASLALMAGGGFAASGIGDVPINRGTVGRGLQAVGNFKLNQPLRIIGKMGKMLENSQPVSAEDIAAEARSGPSVPPQTMPDARDVPVVTDNPNWKPMPRVSSAQSPANSIDDFAKMMADKGGVTDTQAAQQVASRNVSGDWNSNLKPNFTAQDVVRLKLLMANGASEADAVKSVLASRP